MPRDQTGERREDAQNEQRQPPADERRETANGQAADHQGAGSDTDATRWFATTAVRTGLVAIGAVLLLFSLGQAVGLPLLGLVVDAISSQTGQWLVVAFFAVLLIAAAQKGLPAT